ncbi:MAG: metallophosphoesterase [Candidatus Bathyarchaeota archaeon]|nr:metallophosphoesterase [Candidatus Bathyarchaeota archaeon]
MTGEVPLFSFAVISDTHIRPSGESSSPWKTNLMTNDRARWAARRVDAYAPDFVIHLGDIVHPVPHLPTYGSASMVAKEIMGELQSPCYYVPGNHDIGDKNNPTVPAYIVNDSYIEDFKKYYGPTYQSFNHRDVHIVLINSPVLNSGLTDEEEQRDWLESDLEKNRDKRTFIFSHYPPYLYKADEPSNYDNIDTPARGWLLDLLERYSVEAFFAGHVHHYGYKRYYDTHIYNLFSTCFVRQDFSELFRVEAADEYGRNDSAKLGYCIVDIYENSHHVRIYRSYGETLERGDIINIPERVDDTQPFNTIHAPLGVHLRHPLTETVDLPYMGPIDEFVRKRARNDYPVLGLREAGIRTVRLPLNDIIDEDTRQRLYELHDIGHRFGFFTINTPDQNLIAENREIIDFLEVILPWETAKDALPCVSKLREDTNVPVYVANIESSVHRERKGPKFSHYISHGFHIDDTESLQEMLPNRGKIDGFVFQVNQDDHPVDAIKRIAEYSHQMGFKALANIRLASEDPAVYLSDDDYVANRAAEAVVSAFAYPNVKVFLDTYVDHDRGYFPRIGLYDRRINPRKGGHVVRNLQAAITRYGSDISVTKIKEEDRRAIIFESETISYRLSLPKEDRSLSHQQGSVVIDLVTGEINPKKTELGHQLLEVIEVK